MLFLDPSKASICFDLNHAVAPDACVGLFDLLVLSHLEALAGLLPAMISSVSTEEKRPHSSAFLLHFFH